MIRNLILKLTDPFYPLCSRFLNIQTYRYGVCGASNTALDIFLYFVFYNFVLNKQIVSVAGVSISPHIAAFLMAFSITAPTGFLLMRLVVFPESTIRGWVQLTRYFSVVALNLFLNYVLLKLFVDVMDFYPTPAKILNTALIVSITFILQKYFTFRVQKNSKRDILANPTGEETFVDEEVVEIK